LMISKWLRNCSLKSLRKISIVTGASRAGFLKFKLSAFEYLHSLDVLFVSDVESAVIEDIGTITSLKSLIIKTKGEEQLYYRNVVTKNFGFINPNSILNNQSLFSQLIYLNHITLQYCITSPLLPSLANITSLNHLDLSFNTGHLTGKDIPLLQHITQLTQLNLEGNYTIDTNSLIHLSTLTNLTSLNIAYCGWHFLDLPNEEIQLDGQFLVHLVLLKSLNLRGLNLSSIQFILGLTELNVLNISETSYNDDDMNAISQSLVQLRELHLHRCLGISERGIGYLLNLPFFTVFGG